MAGKASYANHLFLVDDHPLVRNGLATVLSQYGFTVCGEANNATETLSHAGLLSADLAIVDLALGEEDGLKLTAALQVRGIRVLVYTMHEEPSRVNAALTAGACGYVTKREVAQYLVEAIHEVLAGKFYVSPRAAAGLAKNVANRRSDDPALSEQQRRIYQLLGEGTSVDAIAAALRVSPRTVESYCARMMEKLGRTGMKELRRQAIADRINGTL